ncbi:Synaptobrevin [Opisthorchis viverrini]|uniref:Synaptobrevin n=1 Tax=Opisthorchis viverrini TaxID=6198 RepID=A0A1S8X491_OPIVI|nr:Synaptobrevin [Opisthorchis viverrini]
MTEKTPIIPNKRLQQTQAQVNEVVDIMRVNVDKVLERDKNLSELDGRAVSRLFLSLQLKWLLTSEHLLAWPTILIPRDMWEQGIFLLDVPRLFAKNAIAVSNVNRQSKPPVTQNLFHIFGKLEMDDEYAIPELPNFAVVTDERQNSLEDNKADEKADDELDQIIGEEQVPQKGAKLLSGLYGTYGDYGPAAVSLVPAV